MTTTRYPMGKNGDPKQFLRKAVVLLIVCLLYACAQVPNRKPVTDPQVRAAAWDLVDHFDNSIPDRFQRTDAIVFTYHSRVMSFLGYSRISSREQTFSIAGLTPLGIKLFQFSGNAQSVNTTYVEKDLARMGDVGETIAGDIRRIYFDNIPDRAALLQCLPGLYVFTVMEKEYRTEYTFSAANGHLVRKRRVNGRKEDWNIVYGGYRKHGGKAYPQSIELNHSRKGYQLTVSLKQLQDT